MSVVRRQTRRRWGVVVALVAALSAAPAAVTAIRAHLGAPAASAAPPEELLARALAAGDVPHAAVAESRGALGLPDLPGFDGVAALLGGTTRTRVWWAGPEDWRVDVLTGTGEVGDYAAPGVLATWDYEADTLTVAIGTPQVRLPRAVDLLPPRVVGRFLGDLGPDDDVSALPDRLVAGRPAAGFRVRPGDPRSSVRAVDVWVHADGLPVAVRILDRSGVAVLTSRYLDVDRGRPAAQLLRRPALAGAERVVGRVPDVASRIDALSVWQLPGSLAGLPAATRPVAGTATYGGGLTRFAVLPLPPGLAWRVIVDARRGGGVALPVEDGEAVLLRRSVLAAVAVRASDGVHAYVLAGTVTPDLLREAVEDLLRSPPPWRGP